MIDYDAILTILNSNLLYLPLILANILIDCSNIFG